MSLVSGKSGLAFALAFGLAALGAGLPVAQAQAQAEPQAGAVPAWTSGWQTGFGGSVGAGQGASPYGDLLAFGGGAAARDNFSSRYSFDNGWFIGNERGGLGFGNFGPTGAWGNLGSLSYEGAQVGYTFSNAPVSVYAGFDTLKFNTAPLTSPLAGFDSQSATSPGYGVHAGVEIRPTSNLSLSLGVGYAQQPGGIDTGINSFAVPGATSFAFGRR